MGNFDEETDHSYRLEVDRHRIITANIITTLYLFLLK